MFLRNLRWAAAGLLAASAVLAAPARSDAAVQVLIEQYLLSNNTVVGPTVILTQNGSGFLTFSTSSSSAWTGDLTRQFDVQVNTFSNSASATTAASFNNQVNVSTTSNFDGTRGLRLVLTDDGFQAPAGTATAFVQNTAGASNALGTDGNGNNLAVVTGQNTTQLLTTPLTTPAASTSNQATGTTVAGSVTPQATHSNPGSSGANASTSTLTTEGFDTYAIQQIIKVAAVPTSDRRIGPDQAFGGTFGSAINLNPNVNPVPAPAGLLLALTALPVLGLRRRMRAKA